jgi:hypothetical protein
VVGGCTLAASWAGNPARGRRDPDDVQFATKPALAAAMIGAALDAGVPRRLGDRR